MLSACSKRTYAGMCVFCGQRKFTDFAVLITELLNKTDVLHAITSKNVEQTHLPVGQTAMCLVSMESSSRI